MSENTPEKTTKTTTRRTKKTEPAASFSEAATALIQAAENTEQPFPMLSPEELKTAVAELLSAPNATAIVQTLAPRPQGEKLVDALTAVGSQEAANALAALDIDTAPKPIRKASRKALFTLKSKGIMPQEQTPQAGSDTAQTQQAWRGWMSGADGAGYRLFILIKPTKARDYMAFIVYDEERHGIYNAYQERVSDPDKFIATYLKEFKEDYLFVEIDAEYAKARVADSIRRKQATGDALPGDTAFWTASLPMKEILSPHPVWNQYSRESIEGSAALQEDLVPLIASPGLRGWFFEVAQIRPAVYKLVEALESKIEVSEAVKQERYDKIVADAADELFTPEIAQAHKLRLEDIAYLWSLKGKEEVDVKRALAAAISMEKEPRHSSFAKILVKQSIAVYLELMKQGKVM